MRTGLLDISRAKNMRNLEEAEPIFRPLDIRRMRKLSPICCISARSIAGGYPLDIQRNEYGFSILFPRNSCDIIIKTQRLNLFLRKVSFLIG